MFAFAFLETLSGMPRLLFCCLLAALSGCTAVPRQTSLASNTLLESTSHLHWCGTLALPGKWHNETPAGGLSALGWDHDESLLYMLSDRGWLHRARLEFRGGKLVGLEPLETYALRGADNALLGSPDNDAESLLLQRADNGIRGDTTLLIGFEQNARLQRFLPDGSPRGNAMTPPGLRGAQSNGGLEALGRHGREGVIAGLEHPPQGMAEGTTRLFALASGAEWTYPLADAYHSGLTALEILDDDLLALERAYAPPASLTITLRRVSLGANGDLTVKTLARLETGAGWSVDNFEGLTRLADNRYLMVSDDNFSLLQKTLLSCFEVTSDG
ncbi:esterase-like activity of phytase family protein [Halomonas sp. WWR20]